MCCAPQPRSCSCDGISIATISLNRRLSTGPQNDGGRILTTTHSGGPSRPTSFSVGLRGDPKTFADFIRLAEDQGFNGIWTQDTLNDKNFSLDPLHQLSYAAGISKHMRLGISVLFSGYRNPAVLARDLATLLDWVIAAVPPRPSTPLALAPLASSPPPRQATTR